MRFLAQVPLYSWWGFVESSYKCSHSYHKLIPVFGFKRTLIYSKKTHTHTQFLVCRTSRALTHAVTAGLDSTIRMWLKARTCKSIISARKSFSFPFGWQFLYFNQTEDFSEPRMCWFCKINLDFYGELILFKLFNWNKTDEWGHNL